MTKCIFKYVINPVGDATFLMPEAAEVVRVGQQNGDVVIWVLLDPDEPKVYRRFVYIGTGHPVPAKGKYLGSADVGQFVWHVFETYTSRGNPNPCQCSSPWL